MLQVEELSQCEGAALRRTRRFSKLHIGAAFAGLGLLVVGISAGSGSAPWSGHHRQQLDIDGLSVLAVEEAANRSCLDIPGVKLAELGKQVPAWEPCRQKWAEDCSASGCCLEGGMKCYKKNDKWAACNSACQPGGEKNDSWACDVVTPPAPRTSTECTAQCRKNPACKQAIFSSEAGGSCLLSMKRSHSVVWAADIFTSSFCGTEKEQLEMESSLKTVKKQLPFQPKQPELVNCSWGGEDCSKTRCCNDVQCDKDFGNCYGYSCYNKTEYFSGCQAGAPPQDWNGKWLGGPREHRTILPAGAQVATQGSSLYCFSVVAWDAPRPKPFWSTEAELANLWKTHGVGIFKCDASDIYSGAQTPVAEWGSFSNIDAFLGIWNQVKDKGTWKKHDWTIKVDADAVFFPQRLKDHLFNLRTPRGSRVYLENINYKFKFMGALEILTREALEVFLELGHTCIRGDHQGGEDAFTKGCMDALGIDHQSDYLLLRDKYAAQNGPCTDGWIVAYHYMKKVSDWIWCHNQAMCGKGEGGCDKALPL